MRPMLPVPVRVNVEAAPVGGMLVMPPVSAFSRRPPAGRPPDLHHPSHPQHLPLRRATRPTRSPRLSSASAQPRPSRSRNAVAPGHEISTSGLPAVGCLSGVRTLPRLRPRKAQGDLLDERHRSVNAHPHSSPGPQARPERVRGTEVRLHGIDVTRPDGQGASPLDHALEGTTQRLPTRFESQPLRRHTQRGAGRPPSGRPAPRWVFG